MSSMFKRIDTVFLEVEEIHKSIEWYTTILGFSLRWHHGEYAALNVSETPITLVQSKAETYQPIKKTYFNLYVTDIDEAYEHFLRNDVKVEEIHRESDVKWFVFYDIDGNRLEVCSF